jgi:hypothetical protein
VVEGGQLGAAAATTDDHDHVEVGVATERAHRSGDLGDGPLALHPHVDQPQLERQPAAFDLVQEVGPRRAGRAGHHADAQRRRRHPASAVPVVETGGHQPTHDIVAL